MFPICCRPADAMKAGAEAHGPRLGGNAVRWASARLGAELERRIVGEAAPDEAEPGSPAPCCRQRRRRSGGTPLPRLVLAPRCLAAVVVLRTLERVLPAHVQRETADE
ncbi:hypothetical protein [Streptomyces sp. NPDC096033]|uniref:hypothetical protein n=1 Tax=Streptomyces sp. NPDC096033 TaxID=3366071 RepID=UPI0037FF3B60